MTTFTYQPSSQTYFDPSTMTTGTPGANDTVVFAGNGGTAYTAALPNGLDVFAIDIVSADATVQLPDNSTVSVTNMTVGDSGNLVLGPTTGTSTLDSTLELSGLLTLQQGGGVLVDDDATLTGGGTLTLAGSSPFAIPGEPSTASVRPLDAPKTYSIVVKPGVTMNYEVDFSAGPSVAQQIAQALASVEGSMTVHADALRSVSLDEFIKDIFVGAGGQLAITGNYNNSNGETNLAADTTTGATFETVTTSADTLPGGGGAIVVPEQAVPTITFAVITGGTVILPGANSAIVAQQLTLADNAELTGTWSLAAGNDLALSNSTGSITSAPTFDIVGGQLDPLGDLTLNGPVVSIGTAGGGSPSLLADEFNALTIGANSPVTFTGNGVIDVIGGTLALAGAVQAPGGSHGQIEASLTTLSPTGQIDINAARFVVQSNIVSDGAINLANGALLEVQFPTVSNAGVLAFFGSGNEGTFEDPGVVGTLRDFGNGDSIDIGNSNFGEHSTLALTGDLLTVLDNNGATIASFTLQRSDSFVYAKSDFELGSNGGSDTLLTTTAAVPDTPACFAEGTRILTVCGPVTVERLRNGDRVATASGGIATVRWLGHSPPGAVRPIRVRCDAFGAGRPHRDLLLSPDHAVFAAGALIPIRHLVNGASVAPMPAAPAVYWHVELEAHAVLFAEGLPAESYLDTGNRAASFTGARSPRRLGG